MVGRAGAANAPLTLFLLPTNAIARVNLTSILIKNTFVFEKENAASATVAPAPPALFRFELNPNPPAEAERLQNRAGGSRGTRREPKSDSDGDC